MSLSNGNTIDARIAKTVSELMPNKAYRGNLEATKQLMSLLVKSLISRSLRRMITLIFTMTVALHIQAEKN